MGKWKSSMIDDILREKNVQNFKTLKATLQYFIPIVETLDMLKLTELYT